MAESLGVLLLLAFCLVVPMGWVVALIMWLNRRSTQPAQLRDERPDGTGDASLDVFDLQVRTWVSQSRLTRETASQVLALIEQDRAARQGRPVPVVPAVPPSPPQPAHEPPQPAQSGALPPRPGIGDTPPTPQPAFAAATMVGSAAAPAQPLPTAGPGWGEQFWSALFALRTRWALLFLGAFLLVVSALILVIFNWNEFPAIVRSALLAGVAAGLWGGGTWLARQPGLNQAGTNLQAVGGLLVPVAAYSLSHPDIFNLAPRNAWLLASALSLPIYVVAAWRSRQVLFAFTGCLAAASAVMAGTGLVGVADQWLPVALALALSTYLPLDYWLCRRGAQDLAPAPFWVAHIGLPLTLLAAILLYATGSADMAVVAATLWLGSGFYGLALALDRKPPWAWAAASLPPLGLLATLLAWEVESSRLPLALALLFTAYLPLTHWLRRRVGPAFTTAPFAVAQAGLPIVLLFSLWVDRPMTTGLTATTFWVGVTFYPLAARIERRPGYGWPVTGLIPVALLITLHAAAIDDSWWGLALALLALAYLAVGAVLEPRARLYTLPAYTGAAALALLALLPNINYSAERWSLPLLIVFGVATVALYHRGRFAWLPDSQRLVCAVAGLAFAGLLLPAWLLTLFPLTGWSIGKRGVALLLLAALYMVGAYWWPGRLRRPYDLTLQILGTLIAIGAGAATLGDETTWAVGAALLTAIWTFQAILRRRWFWAAAALGCALLTAAAMLDRVGLANDIAAWMWTTLAFTLAYALGATMLRRSAWRYWTWPAIGWATLTGTFTLLLTATWIATDGAVQFQQVAAVALLAALLALLSALWRRNWLGYPAAVLLAGTLLLAASADFFASWQPAIHDFGYVLCGLTLGMALLGQGLRRFARPYAYPYELVGFALLTFAPVLAANNLQASCLTWAAMTLLYGGAARLYRLPWAAAPALLAADMALLNGLSWLLPGGSPAGAGQVLLLAAWAQGLFGLWASRREPSAAGGVAFLQRSSLALPVYAVTLLTALGALALASSDATIFARVALGLAALAALLATMERREALAWGALGLMTLGLASLHDALDLDLSWSLAWGVAEALVVCLAGWLTQLGEQRIARLAVWRRPLTFGPLAAGLILTALLLLVAPISTDLPPLTFALATLGLLLATLAVRQRELLYAYGAGAALVAAGLCQLADWGFTEPQWYVIPAGLYLLALAEGLRRFQGRRTLSQVIEAGAALLMLGTTLGQSLRADGFTSTFYALLLCGESLLIVGYGTLRKLRVPFFGGIAFFVTGVTWLSVDPIRAANQWVLLGIVGLLLVGAYVLLERRQEQLVRAGRAFAERISSWG